MAFRCESLSVSSFCSFFTALGVVFRAGFAGAGFVDAGAAFVGVFFGGGVSFFIVAAVGLGFLGVERLDVLSGGFGSRNSSSSSDLIAAAFLFVGVVLGSSLTVLVVVFVGVVFALPFFVPFVEAAPLAG